MAINMCNTLSALSMRLAARTTFGTRYISICRNPLYFKISSSLLAEPVKRKRRVDVNALKLRSERKKRKLEKEIRKLEKSNQRFKRICEIEIPTKLIEEKEKRLRNSPTLSGEEMEKNVLLRKKWARYKYNQYMMDAQKIDSILFSQQRALNELKAESKELYNEAIQVDLSLLPYCSMGPLRTPPIKEYYDPDGVFVDITLKYEGET